MSAAALVRCTRSPTTWLCCCCCCCGWFFDNCALQLTVNSLNVRFCSVCVREAMEFRWHSIAGCCDEDQCDKLDWDVWGFRTIVVRLLSYTDGRWHAASNQIVCRVESAWRFNRPRQQQWPFKSCQIPVTNFMQYSPYKRRVHKHSTTLHVSTRPKLTRPTGV